MIGGNTLEFDNNSLNEENIRKEVVLLREKLINSNDPVEIDAIKARVLMLKLLLSNLKNNKIESKKIS